MNFGDILTYALSKHLSSKLRFISETSRSRLMNLLNEPKLGDDVKMINLDGEVS